MRVWCVRKTDGSVGLPTRGMEETWIWRRCVPGLLRVSHLSPLLVFLPHCSFPTLHRSPGRNGFQPLSMVVGTKEISCPFETYLSEIDLYFPPFLPARVSLPSFLFSLFQPREIWGGQVFVLLVMSVPCSEFCCVLFLLVNNNDNQRYHFLKFYCAQVFFIYSLLTLM